ncbi:hypothetical protein BKA67DRAFT_363282 [Truncatella angustata]|uniref:Uncharacterized protein n=1 Tax=Truncatella angustata TaxID=152316 RepID=A0A9P8UEE3_9PEZI|nr:uncharacterized protein BKA67DRAFT_363282 [Truncatella angustata]KAH6648406.1 hypothetical protein BKA67DRAFT_363282 [Truncatella angustata]
MYTNALLLALAASPLVAAHGKIAVVSGDAGGNGTGIGIMGGVVPGPGKNKVTEVDTTVFGKTDIQTDGLGKTNGNGKNTVAMVKMAMAQSGDTLPQVSSTGGSISGTYHIVTTDGAGPIKAVLDPTGTGAFSTGTMLDVTTQVPGKGGNIKPSKRSLWTRGMDMIMKRASNVNEDYPMAFSVPAGTTCQGSMAGQENVCLVKIANSNNAGPFGGVIAIQMAGASASNSTTKREAKNFSA